MNNLKQYRLKLGLNQDELAKKVGIVRTTINKYETGFMPMSLKTAEKLSKFFGCTADELIGEDKFRASIRSAKKGYIPSFRESFDGFITSFTKEYNDYKKRKKPNSVFRDDKDIELYEELRKMPISTYGRLEDSIDQFNKEDKPKSKK